MCLYIWFWFLIWWIFTLWLSRITFWFLGWLLIFQSRLLFQFIGLYVPWLMPSFVSIVAFCYYDNLDYMMLSASCIFIICYAIYRYWLPFNVFLLIFIIILVFRWVKALSGFLTNHSSMLNCEYSCFTCCTT